MTIEEERSWACAIGGVFINFGIIEFASFRWVEVLSSDVLMRDLAIDMPLAKRIKLIKQLVDRSDWSASKKKRSSELWDEVSGLAELRNTVAHNPFHPGTEAQPAQGIINVKKMKGPGPYTVTLIALPELVNAARRAGELGSELHALWARNG